MSESRALPRPLQHSARRGFSLLEVLLALGLTVIVMTIVFSAVYQYLFILTRQQAEIERKQVARGVVMMINEDLSGAIQFKSEDYSAVANLVASQSLAGIGALSGTGDLSDTETEEIDADAVEQEILDAVAQGGTEGGGDGESDEDSDEGGDEEGEVGGRPTLIGNRNLLRMDTSSLPRLDEYNMFVAGRTTEEQLPSDVKTVTYFYSDSPPAVEDEILPEFGREGGLYVRRIDRAVEAFIGEEDVSDKPDEYCELIAPEVVSIQFRYFDGEEWREEWDSEEEGGCPVAIEVVITLDPQRGLTESAARQQTNPEELEVLRTVVYLPVAEILPEEEEEEEEEEEQESSDHEGEDR